MGNFTVNYYVTAADEPKLNIAWADNGTSIKATGDVCTDCVKYENMYAADLNIYKTFKCSYHKNTTTVNCILICILENNNTYSIIKIEEMVEDMSFSTIIHQMLPVKQ